MSKIIKIIIVLSACLGVTQTVSAAHYGGASYYTVPNVYRVTGDTVCVVANAAQLEAFGAQGQVSEAPPHLDLLAGKRNLGTCPWPDGFYRYPGYQATYYVSGDTRCRLAGPGQLRSLGGAGRVQALPAGPDPLAGLQDTGTCGWPTGFYSYGDAAQVFHVSEERICRVVGPGQLTALGGAQAVRRVGRQTELFAGKRDAGTCVWPDGFYQLPNKPAVYHIRGNTVCTVRSPGQLRSLGGQGQVRTVGSQANLFKDKRDTGACG